MCQRLVAIALAGVASALFAGAADAFTCYLVLDAKDNVVYRDAMSPVDLSERGAAERAALRQRGEYLLIIDTERCVPLAYQVGSAGSGKGSLEDFYSGIPSVISNATAATAARQGSRGGSVAAPSAAPSAAPAPIVPRMRSGY